jgi:type IV pilus assembly protein PilW
MKACARSCLQAQRGMSLVELMVGIAIGLIIVAASATLVSTQLTDNRRLLLETQVQQDLRASADMITRELRRTGFHGAGAALPEEANTLRGIWLADRPSELPRPNDLAVVDIPAASQVNFDYFRNWAEQSFGFKLDGYAIKTKMGVDWQQLSDPNAVKMTALAVTQRVGPAVAIKLMCPHLCADGTDTCWPTLQVRELDVSVTGQPVTDSAMVRTVASRVRLRNDVVTFNVAAAASAPNNACPP